MNDKEEQDEGLRTEQETLLIHEEKEEEKK